MKSLLKSTFLYFNKIKVVHSLPGRLRLSVPGLNQVPEEFKKFEPNLTKLIKLVGGVEEVTYSYVTHKVLLKYNPKKVTEKDILNWIDLVWKEVVKKESAIDEDNIEKQLPEIYEEIKKSLITQKG
ncbi:HMA2 domain-containing protein [Psychrilyobacter sp.]|uniref:HMA2 domain-containing protein n=1 Tax=Psychrilyobacter sp. TaxID=2586924 RepID=UPI003019D0FE